MKVRTRNTAMGRTVYFVDYRDANGARMRRDILNARNKTEAQSIANVLYGGVAMKKLLGDAAPPDVTEKMFTLAALLDADAGRFGIADSTRAVEKYQAQNLIRVFGAGFRALDLSGKTVDDYKAARTRETAKPRTVNIELQLLRAAINRAVRAGLLSRPPCHITKVNEPRPRKRFLHPNELAALLRACRETRGLLEPAMFLANTGARPAEMWALRWQDIDTRAKVAHVMTTKRAGHGGPKTEPLPLNAGAWGAVQARRKEQGNPSAAGLVFGITPDARRVDRKAAKRGFMNGRLHLGDHRFPEKLRAAARRAGLARPNEITPYTLRHSFASAALAGGASVKDVQAVLRHSTPLLTLQTYCHESMPGMRAAVKIASFAPSKTAPEGTRKDGRTLQFSKVAGESGARRRGKNFAI
ncbi:MAG: tyrosine-type recombinase/integrase [Candidatus Sumerlaeota bacterium]|nr:tyrosine-type recombinase/integrase [Candidatus Sumerlaeota bacterium]